MDGVFVTELQWLLPYYERVKHKLGDHELVKVYPVYLHDDKVNRYFGQCTTTDDYTYQIGLYTQYWKIQKLYPFVRVRRPLSTIDILHTFAHELAHIAHWEHTPEHKRLECQIMSMFCTQLKYDGYISEEDELS
jgi:hypothetical protein